MKFLVRLFHGGLLLLLCMSLCGCLPSGQGELEEEKEPYFLAGQSLVNSMDYKGAVESFEKALEVNPHSASAHFELALLCEEREGDPAAAIYHYEQFLKLRPNSAKADFIRQHITACKQDLAKTVLPLPVTPAMQRDFEKLAEENKRLREEVANWQAYYQSLARSNAQAQSQAPARPAPAQSQPVQLSATQPNPRTDIRPSGVAASARTYTVKPDDSLYSIARKYGVKLEALVAANPGVDPHRLRPGQSVNIPAP